MASRHPRTWRLFAVMCFGVALSTGSALRAQEVKGTGRRACEVLGYTVQDCAGIRRARTNIFSSYVSNAGADAQFQHSRAGVLRACI